MRSHTERPVSFLLEYPPESLPKRDRETGSLDFPKFTCWSSTSGYRIPTEAEQDLIATFLADVLKVKTVVYHPPYVSLCVNQSIAKKASEYDLFTIAGFVVVWQPLEVNLWRMPEGLHPGRYSLAKNPLYQRVEDPELIAELKPYKIPTAASLRALGKQFPYATHIIYLNSRIIIECPEQQSRGFKKKLALCPKGFIDLPLELYYSNGPMRYPLVDGAPAALPCPDCMEYGEEHEVWGSLQIHKRDNEPPIRIKCLGKRVRNSYDPAEVQSSCQAIFVNSVPNIYGSFLCYGGPWLHGLTCEVEKPSTESSEASSAKSGKCDDAPWKAHLFPDFRELILGMIPREDRPAFLASIR